MDNEWKGRVSVQIVLVSTQLEHTVPVEDRSHEQSAPSPWEITVHATDLDS